MEDSKFEFCLAYRDQIEKLLYHCAECGELPRNRGDQSKRNVPIKRNITWTIKGTSATASWYCSCNGKKTPLTWSTQPFIEETQMRLGNLAVTAAMVVAPIDHTSMHHFAKAIHMPFFSEQTFHLNKRYFVNPAIEELYEKHRNNVLDQVIDAPPKKLDIAIDAQYDSPGYSAEIACETMMDIKTHVWFWHLLSHTKAKLTAFPIEWSFMEQRRLSKK